MTPISISQMRQPKGGESRGINPFFTLSVRLKKLKIFFRFLQQFGPKQRLYFCLDLSFPHKNLDCPAMRMMFVRMIESLTWWFFFVEKAFSRSLCLVIIKKAKQASNKA